MLLAVEVGNSSVVAGVFRGAELAATRRWPSDVDPARTAELGGWLEQFVPPHAAVMAGVAPKVLGHWCAAAEALGLAVRIVGDDLPAPIPVRYNPPESVGIDRLLTAAAAVERYGAPVLVADLGTATTVNAVAADGAFVGGAIGCGLGLARDALAARTALLPSIALAPPERAIGRSTGEGLLSGLLLGQAGAIGHLAARFREELGATDAPLIGTGGWSELVAAAAPGLFDAVVPTLALEGLRLAWQRSAK